MRKSKPRQLSFVFADSPQGAGRAEKVDVSTQPTQPVHKANDNDHSATAPPRGGPFSGYRPEEPDVRSTSPVLWEPRGGNSPRLPDMAVGRELALPGDQIPRPPSTRRVQLNTHSARWRHDPESVDRIRHARLE